MDGEYVKYNDNWSWCDDKRNTPQVSWRGLAWAAGSVCYGGEQSKSILFHLSFLMILPNAPHNASFPEKLERRVVIIGQGIQTMPSVSPRPPGIFSLDLGGLRQPAPHLRSAGARSGLCPQSVAPGTGGDRRGAHAVAAQRLHGCTGS